MPVKALLVAAIALPVIALAQPTSDVRALIDRLDRLEQQNRAMAGEIQALRQELASKSAAPAIEAASPPLEERLDVHEQRIEDLAQSKVEGGQKLPVRLAGMALFNAYLNTGPTNGAENPVVVPVGGGSTAGAYVRQSILGLEFDGPRIAGGGKLSGTLYMDFFAGSSSTLNHLMRIRTASIQADWKNASFLVGQQKPIFSPRDPVSLAQVGVSPLTGAGNPWLWLPQARFEQRISLGERAQLRAQIGVVQTNEQATTVSPEYTSDISRSRPALEGRFEFRLPGKLEIAPGFHTSKSHVLGVSIPSTAYSVDWLFAPAKAIEVTGLLYGGQNLANLGTLRQGFTITERYEVIPVHTWGGWAQLSILPAGRLSFHLMSGQADDRNSDLQAGGIGKNLAYGGNVMYRIAPNVTLAFESLQTRTSYVGGPVQINTHYDLAIAYLF